MSELGWLVLVAVSAVALASMALRGVARLRGRELAVYGLTLGFAAGLGRLALICLYLTACLVALGAIGLFASTLTEQPIAAGISVLVVTVVSQILDQISQLSAIHRFLPTHYWLDFSAMLRDPLDLGDLGPGLASAAAYVASPP